MDIAAFIIAVIAAVLFAVDYSRHDRRAYIPLGLCLLTVAWIVQSLWVTQAHQLHF